MKLIIIHPSYSVEDTVIEDPECIPRIGEKVAVRGRAACYVREVRYEFGGNTTITAHLRDE